jgi:hypothetical protein
MEMAKRRSCLLGRTVDRIGEAACENSLGEFGTDGEVWGKATFIPTNCSLGKVRSNVGGGWAQATYQTAWLGCNTQRRTKRSIFGILYE